MGLPAAGSGMVPARIGRTKSAVSETSGRAATFSRRPKASCAPLGALRRRLKWPSLCSTAA